MKRVQEIYNFMNGRDISTSYQDAAHNSKYDFSDFVAVTDEVNRVKAEFTAKKDGAFLLSSDPDTYYEYTTDEDVVSSIVSDLNVQTIISTL
jgi:6-pyruvoyl-tetrahydropterin synthase